MSTAASLSDRSKTELASMARRKGIRGWESLSKVDLLKALSPRPPARELAPKSIKAKASTKPAIRVTTPTRSVPKSAAKPMPKPAANSAAKVTKPLKNTKPLLAARSAIKAPALPPARTGSNGVLPARTGTTTNGSHKAATETGPETASAKATTTKPVAKPSVKPPPAPPTREHSSRAAAAQTKDRVYLAVNDPYWLHVMWDLSAHSISRAEAALKQDWYGAKLIIRLFDVTSQDTTSTSETPIRDIPIESDGRNWYINVSQPPRQYRADIGYLSRRGDFFPLAKSNVATPPKAGSSEALDAGWEKDPKKAERILAMTTGFESATHPELKVLFEERLRRPLGAPKESAFGSGAMLPGSLKKFYFEIDARLIVLGRTDPSAHLTLGNDPVDLNSDGTFVMSFSLPDSRQIIPAVATSADGVEERTIVLAVERNTKYLDPMIHDQMSEI